MDGAYTQKYLAVATMLLDASGGDPSRIPWHYAEHLRHEYHDGDISLVHLLPRLDHLEGLEDFEIDEALELLSRVTPGDWPDPEDIQKINPAELLRMNDSDTDDTLNYVESAATASEKAEKVLRHTIESVFGDKVDKVRSTSGEYPDVDNQYLQTEGGSFEGSFEYDGKKFDFTIEPDESGWTVQYRLTAKSLDNLPPVPPDSVQNDTDTEKKSHGRGWK